MGANYKIHDGRNFNDLFDADMKGSSDFGFRLTDGVDVGRNYAPLSLGTDLGINTGYRAPDGKDLREKLAKKGTIFQPVTNRHLLTAGGYGLDNRAYFKLDFFTLENGFTHSSGGIRTPIWAVHVLLNGPEFENIVRGIRMGRQMTGSVSTYPANNRGTMYVTQWPTVANGGVLLIDYHDYGSGSGDSSCDLAISI